MRLKGNLLVFLIVLLLTAASTSGTAVKAAKPRLLRVVMYEWGLGTGGTNVDMKKGKLESFLRGTDISEEERKALLKKMGGGYPVYRIQAHLTGSELVKLRKMVDDSGLHDFKPKESDLKKRQPFPDECPPNLVLIYSDGKRVFQLPLSDTVKNDAATSKRRHFYRSMDDICRYLWSLDRRYDKLPYVSAVPVHGKRYKEFERERERMVGM